MVGPNKQDVDLPNRAVGEGTEAVVCCRSGRVVFGEIRGRGRGAHPKEDREGECGPPPWAGDYRL